RQAVYDDPLPLPRSELHDVQIAGTVDQAIDECADLDGLRLRGGVVGLGLPNDGSRIDDQRTWVAGAGHADRPHLVTSRRDIRLDRDAEGVGNDAETAFAVRLLLDRCEDARMVEDTPVHLVEI